MQARREFGKRATRAARVTIAMAAAMLAALSIGMPRRADAKTQPLCVNVGGTLGCEATISDAVALITQSTVTITVSPGTYLDDVLINTGPTPKTLTLTITGSAGAATTIIDGNGIGSVFKIGAKAKVTLTGLTIENGVAGGSPTLGGGISASNATVVVADCVIMGNQANFGGGIYTTDSNLSVTDSLITNNSALNKGTSTGGGIDFEGSKARKLVVLNSTIDSNSAAVGGGISLAGTLSGPIRLNGTISGSAISNNSSMLEGAGLFDQFAKLSVSNSTISGNDVISSGGGICTFEGDMTMNNVMVANNSARIAGGILANINDKKFVISNTLIAANISASGADCNGTLMSQDYNFVGDMAGCTLTGKTTHNLTGNPMLGPLQNNGGTTETQALLAGRTALGAGNPATPNGIGNHCEPEDQIGTPRPMGQCDIGAYQAP